MPTSAIPETSFQPGDLAHAPDPYAALAEVRRLGSIVRSGGLWLVLGHTAAEQLLRHPATRSGFIATMFRSMLPPGAAREEMGHRINFLDPPDHGRVRRLVSQAFTPRRIAALRPYVAQLSRDLLSQLAQEPEPDLLSGFAHQVPSRVISELLGVPFADRDQLTHLADEVSHLLGLAGLDADTLRRACDAAEELHAYLRALLAERRRQPQDDLLTALSIAEEDQQRLSESELLSLAATLYSAGHRTTRDLFINGTAALLARPPLVAAIRDGSLPVPAVISEYLRFETPTHYVGRMLAEPAVIDGIELPAGEPIVVLLAAANHDPDVYADAASFDPRRWLGQPEPPAPLSFAFGPHYCLGANLARLEAEEMLTALVEVLPHARQAHATLPWHHTGLFRGLDTYRIHPGRDVSR